MYVRAFCGLVACRLWQCGDCATAGHKPAHGHAPRAVCPSFCADERYALTFMQTHNLNANHTVLLCCPLLALTSRNNAAACPQYLVTYRFKYKVPASNALHI